MPNEGRYDDSAFSYFAMSVLAVILIPWTFSYIKVWKSALSSKYTGICKCENCVKKAEKLQKESRVPSKWSICKFAIVIILWIFFFYLVSYASSSFKPESVAFDPYKILEVDVGATPEEIKKAYRSLSLKWHPDKNQEPEAHDKYINIAKAYDTLTDDETREKWEKYGNPDGPKGFTVGIALPSFLVESKNSLAVLAFYIVFLVVVFPIVAICYWQSQQELAPNKIIKRTMYLYWQALRENMRFKKLMEILCASNEYTKLPIRRSDEEILMKLKPLVPDVVEDKKVHKSKKKVYSPFIIKHMMIFFGHFERLHGMMKPIEADVEYIIKEAHKLIGGMVELSVTGGRRWLTPTLESIWISQMVAQAVWSETARVGRDTSFLQLPHFRDDMSTKLMKKFKIYNILGFIQMDPSKRRDFLTSEGLSPAQIQDIENVTKQMPQDIKMNMKCEVDEDDENVGITGGAIVTLVATFERPSQLPKNMTPEMLEQEKKEQSNVKESEETAFVNKKLEKKEKFEDPFKVKLAKEEELIEVHAPYFPEKKHELWWLIIGDERTGRIMGLTRIQSLKHKTEARIPFPAPPKAGEYSYMVYLLPDCYVGFDIKKPLKLTVAKETAIVQPEDNYDEENENEDNENEENNENKEEEEVSEGSDDD